MLTSFDPCELPKTSRSDTLNSACSPANASERPLPSTREKALETNAGKTINFDDFNGTESTLQVTV